MSHTFRLAPAVSIACALMLAACGGSGGGGDSTAKSAASVTPTAYMGTWEACTTNDEKDSWSASYTFHDASGAYTYIEKYFSSAGCVESELTRSLTVTGRTTWSGQFRTVEGVKADEVEFVPEKSETSEAGSLNGNPTERFKQILAVESERLYLGDRSDSSTLGADGFPTGFSATAFKKQ